MRQGRVVARRLASPILRRGPGKGRVGDVEVAEELRQLVAQQLQGERHLLGDAHPRDAVRQGGAREGRRHEPRPSLGRRGVGLGAGRRQAVAAVVGAVDITDDGRGVAAEDELLVVRGHGPLAHARLPQQADCLMEAVLGLAAVAQRGAARVEAEGGEHRAVRELEVADAAVEAEVVGRLHALGRVAQQCDEAQGRGAPAAWRRLRLEEGLVLQHQRRGQRGRLHHQAGGGDVSIVRGAATHELVPTRGRADGELTHTREAAVRLLVQLGRAQVRVPPVGATGAHGRVWRAAAVARHGPLAAGAEHGAEETVAHAWQARVGEQKVVGARRRERRARADSLLDEGAQPLVR